MRGSDLRWLNRERLQEVKTGLAAQHKWLPEQTLPFSEVVLHAYAADRTPFPTYVYLPSGLYKARTGQVVAQTGPEQEILSLPGIYFFDGWRVHPTLPIPDHLPRAKEAPVQDIALTAPAPGTEPKRSPEEEARDILATAAKNQPEDGPNTRRAAVRACKYLRAMVNQYESTIQAVHIAARTHTRKSKGTVGPAVDYRPQGEALPVISSDLTSELLHCLSTLPDPWPLAKITIDMEKPSQWVSKLCRLYFAYGNLTPCVSTLWVRVKRHAIHHWLYSLCTEDMWKVTARSHGRLVENTLLIAERILDVTILCHNILLVFGLVISDIRMMSVISVDQ